MHLEMQDLDFAQIFIQISLNFA